MMITPGPARLDEMIQARFEQSAGVPNAFFSQEVDKIAQACWSMAKRFHQGGRLIAFGNGPCATDAQHVAVEFVHPVIVGKRALPALALTNDSAFLSGRKDQPGPAFDRQLSLLARPQDMALAISPGSDEENLLRALAFAKEKGLLTLGLTGAGSEVMAEAGLDYCFMVPSRDGFLIQETHEILYHILWELVHVFFEHEGMLI